jgi:tripartite-type tricarboxylate transporter receptor subunit TctC
MQSHDHATRHAKARTLISAAVLAMASAATCAQSYPSKPLRLLVPFPPGEGTDITLRNMAQQLAPRLGQPVVVENRAGGNFIIGAQACTSSAPDGYTVCMVNGTMMSVNPYVIASLPYDPDRDFRPLTNMYFVINGIFVHSGVAASSLKELAQLASAKTGAIDFGTLGPNSSSDIQRQWLNEQWKTSMVGIPYKGGNLIVAAVAAQQIHATWIGLFNGMTQTRAGKVKPLAVFSPRRSPLLPDVPTLEELGYADVPLPGWHGLALPASTPEALQRRLNTDIVATFREPKFAEYIASQGLDVAVGPPEEFAAFMKRDRESTGAVVRRFNIPKQ